jgi:hypothetical protein
MSQFRTIVLPPNDVAPAHRSTGFVRRTEVVLEWFNELFKELDVSTKGGCTLKFVIVTGAF